MIFLKKLLFFINNYYICHRQSNPFHYDYLVDIP